MLGQTSPHSTLSVLDMWFWFEALFQFSSSVNDWYCVEDSHIIAHLLSNAEVLLMLAMGVLNARTANPEWSVMISVLLEGYKRQIRPQKVWS